MSDSPISIACSACTNQVAKTYEWLRANDLLECPVCGHHMTRERAAVVQHVETIRSKIGAVAN